MWGRTLRKQSGFAPPASPYERWCQHDIYGAGAPRSGSERRDKFHSGAGTSGPGTRVHQQLKYYTLQTDQSRLHKVDGSA